MEIRQADFHKIYEEHYPPIFRYLRRIVGEADAEDVAQEVFLKVSRSLADFRGDAKLSTWIYRIATNAAMDHLRKRGRDHSKQESGDSGFDDDPGRDDSFADESSPLPDTLLLRKDMNECIRGIVDRLPAHYRAILILSDLEGMTNAEVCSILDFSLETVKIRLHRARKLLKAELEKNCTFYRDERNEMACDPKKNAPIVFLKKTGQGNPQ